MLLFFTTNVAAKDVQSEISRVLHGYTTYSESVEILARLEKQMPYENALDDAQVMAFKCWFSNVSTPNGISEYKQFLETAKPVIHQANNLNLIQELAVCEANQEYTQGNYQKALEHLKPIINTPSLDEITSSKKLSIIALAHIVLNRIQLAKGNYQEAFDSAKTAYQLFEKAGNDYEKALALKEIADIHIALYNYELAIEQLQRAKLALTKFNEQEQYKVADQLAYTYEEKGDLIKAIELYESIKKDVRRFESDNGYAYILIKLTELNIRLNSLSQAESYLTELSTLSVTDSWILTLYNFTKSEWYLATAQLQAALTSYEKIAGQQQAWPATLKERYLNLTSQLAAATGDTSLQIASQQQLIALIKNKQQAIANNTLISARLNFNYEQQNLEISRLEHESKLQQKLLAVAEDKSFWQGLTMMITCLCLLLFAVYTFKQVRQKKYFEILALKDELTGIANRRAILNLKRSVMLQNKLNQQVSSLISIDIDHFKAVNDQYGHDIGDELIISITNTIVQTVRCSDRVGRVGGEEFLIVLENQSLDHAKDIAERIRLSVAEKEHTSLSISATISLGVIEIAPNETSEQAAKRVDLNLYTAKRSGRNSVVV
ncbi:MULTISPECIES: GGDEF domain-containing protein [Pseudoalteromonas]|uniref:GGDEF domain-containing protein n=1 Tax=Pseudoalteromonas TaxID=53246 RepID=UPI00158167A2|nr:MULTISPECIES: GGDEF domain-containing protein [Pseudoalteromonas]MDI4652934.1 GGDEF domain-containing protein [Pseudoalteromonas shioyasakiensis]NUJ38922.1 diguanylate cyclase [Pseudoalteromonas sp. 0303]